MPLFNLSIERTKIMNQERKLEKLLYSKTTFKNKLNIKNQEELFAREKLIAAIKSMMYENSYIKDMDFNLERLQETNKFLIGDLYDFAGKIRDIDMIYLDHLEKHKNLIDFTSANNIKNEFGTLMYNLNHNYTYYTDIEKKYILCASMADLYHIHPFYRANSLSIVLYMNDYAKNNLNINLDIYKLVNEYDIEQLLCTFCLGQQIDLVNAVIDVDISEKEKNNFHDILSKNEIEQDDELEI